MNIDSENNIMRSHRKRGVGRSQEGRDQEREREREREGERERGERVCMQACARVCDTCTSKLQKEKIPHVYHNSQSPLCRNCHCLHMVS